MIAALVGGGIITVVALSKATEVLGAASIPIWGMVIAGAVFLFRGPFGDAVLHSIAQSDQDRDVTGADPAMLAELDDLRAQVAEMQERLDFTERLIAQQRESRPLAAGERS
jgi:hypothetical protein